MSHIAFVIPVRHPENARDWGLTRRQLSQTLTSIAAQDTPGWRGVVVANRGSELPPMPEGFEVVWVDLPPNPLHDVVETDRERAYRAVRLDKGRRLLAGYRAAAEAGSEYVMFADDDDFVSRRLSGFVRAHRGAPGWCLVDGYKYSPGERFLVHIDHFWRRCGTSHVVRTDLYRLLGDPDDPDDDYLSHYFGDHLFIRGALAEAGRPLAPLPFPGAVYRVAHANSHGDPAVGKGLLRREVLNRALLRRPLRNLRALARLGRVTPEIRREFSLPSGRRA